MEARPRLVLNGPQMRSHSTKEFMAACAIMQRFGRPGTPTDQAWIGSLFGPVKGDWPHLEKPAPVGHSSAALAATFCTLCKLFQLDNKSG